jgi:hypothetical protein
VTEKHENHETEADPTKIGGVNTAKVVPIYISTLSNITNTTTMMKRE